MTAEAGKAEESEPVNYNAYIQSEKWRRFRARYFRFSGHSKACVICGDNEVQLHHVTYANLGNEKYEDVIPLCQMHHATIHAAHAHFGIPLENFEEARKRALLEKQPKKFGKVQVAKSSKRRPYDFTIPKRLKRSKDPEQARWNDIEAQTRKGHNDTRRAEASELARKQRLGVIRNAS